VLSGCKQQLAPLGRGRHLPSLDHLDDARLHLDVADQAAANQTALLEEQALVVAVRRIELLPALEVGHISGVRPMTRIRESNRPVEYIRHVVVELAVAEHVGAPRCGRG